mgnify:CR=1 FL=1
MTSNTVLESLHDLTADTFLPSVDAWEKYIRDIDEWTSIAHGATSYIYEVPSDPNVVVKKYTPCDAPGTAPINKVNCRLMVSKKPVTYINSPDKQILVAPNYLADGIVGSVLNTCEPYTQGFTHTYACYYSPISKSSYTILEKVRTDWENVYLDRYTTACVILDTLNTLMIAQKLGRFTHYDLHLGNLGYATSPDPKVYRYKNKVVQLRDTPVIPKILDYGTSRVETQQIQVALINEKTPENTFGMFNTYYDLCIFLGPRFLTSSLPLAEAFRNVQDFIYGILKYVFYQIQGEYPRVSSLDEIYSTYYRGTRPEPYLNLHIDMAKVVDYAIQALETYIVPGYPPILPPLPDNYVPYTLYSPDVTDPLGFSVRTQVLETPTGNTLASLVYFNPSDIPDMKFSYACCKVDLMTYMESRVGVAINGTFFDVGNTYQPVGNYRELDTTEGSVVEYSNNIPYPYINDYSAIVINDGSIDIQATLGSEYGSYVLTGPLLVYDGEIVFDTAKLESTITHSKNDKLYFYKCSKTPEGGKHGPYVKKDQGYEANCDRITPGQLSHAANPNPRSMLGITANGTVVFAVFKGRTADSAGVSIPFMAEYAKALGLVKAVNLDGGQSSNIALHRSLDDPVEGLIRIYPRPVGNVIHFGQA